jgi:Uma2 family endonuclease
VIVLNANLGLLTDAGCEGPPDFVVEILSPKTRRLDLENKKRVYARLGVKELWIIDPEPREVVVYQFAENAAEPVDRWQRSDTAASPLLPGLKIELEEVFRQ